MEVPGWIWAVAVIVTVAAFAGEFFSHVRRPHRPGLVESSIWTAVYVVLACIFGAVLGAVAGWEFGGEFFAGFLTEKALSVDNLFVILLILTRLRIPEHYQQRVLFFAILIALILRGSSSPSVPP